MSLRRTSTAMSPEGTNETLVLGSLAKKRAAETMPSTLPRVRRWVFRSSLGRSSIPGGATARLIRLQLQKGWHFFSWNGGRGFLWSANVSRGSVSFGEAALSRGFWHRAASRARLRPRRRTAAAAAPAVAGPHRQEKPWKGGEPDAVPERKEGQEAADRYQEKQARQKRAAWHPRAPRKCESDGETDAKDGHPERAPQATGHFCGGIWDDRIARLRNGITFVRRRPA